ncbi:MAG: hypothetical protein GC159_14960 [Phycisphaera sp.]|nr:hypothetical protein [Phycisphaera sp.]
MRIDRHRGGVAWAACLTFAAILATLATTSTAHAEETKRTPITRLLPEDTLFVVMCRDVPALRENWKKHPLAQIWDDPQIERFTAPGRRTLEAEVFNSPQFRELGLKPEELIELPKGQMAIALLRPPAPEDADANLSQRAIREKRRPRFVAIMDVGTDGAKVEQIMKWGLDRAREDAPIDVKLETRTEEHSGITMHLMDRTGTDGLKHTLGWAMVNNWMVYADPVERLAETIDRVRGDESLKDKPTLDDTKNYKGVRVRIAKADMAMYLDLEQIVHTVVNTLESRIQLSAGKDSPALATLHSTVKALALERTRGAYAGLFIHEDYTDLDAGFYFDEVKGLMELIVGAFGDKPVTLPAWIPPDVAQAEASTFGISRGWSSLKNIVGEANPLAAAMMNQQIATAGAKGGVNLDQDILSNFGSHVVHMRDFQTPEPGRKESVDKMDDMWVIKVENPAGFEDALMGMIDADPRQEGKWEPVTHNGTTINTRKMGRDGNRGALSYTMKGGYALMSTGSTELMNRVIDRWEEPNGGLWDRPDLKKALAGLPPDAVYTGFTDVASVLSGLVEMLAFLPDEAAGRVAQVIDIRMMPNPKVFEDAFGPSINALYIYDGSMHFKSRQIHAKGKLLKPAAGATPASN